MSLFSQAIAIYEAEIEGFNQRVLTLDDLRAACRNHGLLLLMEPFPGPGIYLCRRGVPVLTVNRRLDREAALFMGFFGLFHHCLRPGRVLMLEEDPELKEPRLQAAVLASVALLPSHLLLEPLPRFRGPDKFANLMSRLIDYRLRLILGVEGLPEVQQAL